VGVEPKEKATVEQVIAVGNDFAHDAVKTVSHLGAAALFSMSLGLILRLVLPRALGRDSIGILYFSESFSALFFTFLPLGLTAYIVREVPVDHRKASAILPTLVPALGLWAALIWCVMMVSVYGSGADQSTVLCVAAMGVYSAATVFQRAILRRTYVALGRSAFTAQLEMVVRILLLILVLLAVLSGASVLGVVCCYAVSEVLGVIYLLLRASRDGHLIGKFDRSLLNKMVGQTMPFFAVGALVEIYGNINAIMLRYLANNQEVAYFGAADKLKGMGLLMVPVMQTALQPVLSRAWHGDRDEFRRLVSNSMRLLSAVSLPLTLVLMLVPDLLSDVIFGAEFKSSYRSISFLAPVLMMTYMNVLIGSCLNIISDGKKFLWVTAISLLLNVLLNIVCIRIGTFLWGDGGAAAGSSIATVASEVFVLMSVRRIFPQGLEHDCLFGLMMVAVIPCTVLAINFQVLLSWNIWLRVSLILIAPFYLWITRLVRRDDLIYLMNLRKKVS